MDCVLILIYRALFGCIINNPLMVAPQMILGSKMQREYLQDEIFGELKWCEW